MKAVDKWCVARNGMNPCERCKRHIDAGEYYWGRSIWRWCWECAPGIAAVRPPVRYYAIARWTEAGYELQEWTWPESLRGYGRTQMGLDGPIQPPCDADCVADWTVEGELDCPFSTCPHKVAAVPMEGPSS